MRGRDIICVSTHYWNERWFRKQEFMSRFGEENRVLFVEPSFSMARAPEPHLAEFSTNRFLLSRVEQGTAGVRLLKPPRGLPKWTDPRIERMNYRWYGRGIARAARRLGFSDPILWIYRPAFLHALDAIPHSRLVFDLVDDLTAYEQAGSERHAYVEECVTELVQRSDLLVVTAKTLLERYGPGARDVEHVPNGFNASVFSADGERPPEALDAIPRPILGFIGTLFTFLDFELMEAIAERHTDKSMVLVGPVEPTAAAAVERLVRHPNVFHMGSQPKASIPAWVEGFDVCLNPFKTGRAADSVNPLKVYEYLAMGRPVVSAPMEALRREDAGPLVSFADGEDQWTQEIDRALATDGPEAQRARREAAAPYSWENLFHRLSAAADRALTK